MSKRISGVDAKAVRDMYSMMLKIRRFEEKVVELYPEQEMRCPCHLSIGQEAVAAGVCANLRREDYVFGTHRGHASYIAKGGSLKALAAELYGKRTGCSKGKGGSMHLAAPEVGYLGCSSLVGGTIPIAVGAAFSSVYKRKKSVSVVFFGDGAIDEGVFYESLNFAALKKLPVIFVCENNFYATHSHQLDRQPKDNIYKRAEIYGMPGVRTDGNDVIKVFKAAKKAISQARSGKGPSLIEYITYRWREHVGPNYDFDFGYRTKQELNLWMKKCPLERLKKIASRVEHSRLERKINKEVESAFVFAKKSPYPSRAELAEGIFQ